MRFSEILARFTVVRKGCHLNPIWGTFSLGGPSESIGFIFNPLESMILIFKGALPHNTHPFSSWFVRHTWSHSYSVVSLCVEKKNVDPKQIAGMPIYFHILPWETAKLMTSLHCAYITFLGNFLKSGLFSLWLWFLLPRSFLCSSVYVFNSIFWGYYRIFTAWVRWTKTLCTTYIKWKSWWAWALKMAFCVSSTFEAFVWMSCRAAVFSNVAIREQSQH